MLPAGVRLKQDGQEVATAALSEHQRAEQGRFSSQHRSATIQQPQQQQPKSLNVLVGWHDGRALDVAHQAHQALL